MVLVAPLTHDDSLFFCWLMMSKSCFNGEKLGSSSGDSVAVKINWNDSLRVIKFLSTEVSIWAAVTETEHCIIITIASFKPTSLLLSKMTEINELNVFTMIFPVLKLDYAGCIDI